MHAVFVRLEADGQARDLGAGIIRTSFEVVQPLPRRAHAVVIRGAVCHESAHTKLSKDARAVSSFGAATLI